MRFFRYRPLTETGVFYRALGEAKDLRAKNLALRAENHKLRVELEFERFYGGKAA